MLLKRTVILACVSYWILSLVQTSYAQDIFRDDFSLNTKRWKIVTNKSSVTFENGMLVLSSDDEYAKAEVSQPVKFQADQDFEINARIKTLTGNGTCGVSWGEPKNNYAFSLNTKGEFTLFQMEDGGMLTLHPWTAHKAIQQNGPNGISISYRDHKLHFLVNDVLVLERDPLSQTNLDLKIFTTGALKVQVDVIAFSQKQFPINTLRGSADNRILRDLGPTVNSKNAEEALSISANGRVIYFSRDDDNSRSDIYSTRKDPNSHWTTPIKAPAPLNNDGTNFVVSNTIDENAIYLGNKYSQDGSKIVGPGVSVSRRTKRGWSVPVEMKINGLANYARFSHFNISHDGHVLILCIQPQKFRGDLDLYISFLQPDSTWSAPTYLDGKLNSLGNEATAYLAADGITLYYASNGKQGYGNYDLFMTRRTDDSWLRWTDPVNLGAAVNSRKSEMFFTMPASGNIGYMIVNTENEKSNIVSVQLPTEGLPRPMVIIRGNVYDVESNKPLAANIHYENLNTSKEIGMVVTNAVDGSFKLGLVAGNQYGLRAAATGYFSIASSIDLKKLNQFGEQEMDLFLVPIRKDQIIPLNNVFFESGKFDLQKESILELERLCEFLSAHPNMSIEIAGHTDSIGDDEANQTLSENRAKAVAKYLVAKGIVSGRLTPTGHGKSKPVASNDSSKGRQSNRRVEFRILTY